MESDDEFDSQDILNAFNKDPLTRAVRKPERVRQLLHEGHSVTEDAIRAAFACSNIETLQEFLKTDAPFDTRSRARHNPSTGIDSDWTNRDETPRFSSELRFCREDSDDWYAIQHAAFLSPKDQDEWYQQADIMITLLNRQPGLFAVFPQRLFPPTSSVFPGEKRKQPNSSSSKDNGSQTEAPSYGLRSVLHSILEDGGRVDPILNHPTLSPHLDLEHRDPQGRTLFLSMCRSPIGADARIDAVLQDVMTSRRQDSWQNNPFSTTKDYPSLSHTLLTLGANPLATDSMGKTALHHLLDSADHFTHSHRPTGIHKALHHLLQHYPSLVNQPDHHGTPPLHSALQRLYRYPVRWNWDENQGLDTVVEDLLATGANPLALDPKGNTAIHYCAANGLIEPLLGDHTRRLFRQFLDRGVDINARNHAGQSALEMVLGASSWLATEREREHKYEAARPGRRTAEEIDEEVFGWFEEAGVRWRERDRWGRTLLHVVARCRGNRRGPERAEMLLACGVELDARDEYKRTAMDIAVADGNRKMVDVLARKRAELLSEGDLPNSRRDSL